MPKQLDSTTVERQRRRQHAATAHQQLGRFQPHWAIYGPGDPGSAWPFRARLWTARPRPRCTTVEIGAMSLEELRSLLPRGLSRHERREVDVGALVETWS